MTPSLLAGEGRYHLAMRRIALGLLTTSAFTAVCLTAPLPAQDDPEGELRAAQQQLGKGKLTKARLLFEELLALQEEKEGDRPPPEILRQARLGLNAIDLREGK